MLGRRCEPTFNKFSRRTRPRTTTCPEPSSPARLQRFFPRSIPRILICIASTLSSCCIGSLKLPDRRGGPFHNSLYGDLYVKLSVGTTRGESAHWARSIAPRPCIRLDPRWTRTMKQSFASTARLRGGGPILPTASKPWSCSGHRHLGSSLTASRESAIGRQSYGFALLDHQPRS